MSNVVPPKYMNVEELLVKYIFFRMDRYKYDKCGLSYTLLRCKTKEFASMVLGDDELSSCEASNGWIHKLLHRHNIVGIKLHGEANEISVEEAAQKMDVFRAQLHVVMESLNISLERVFNADQTGLFYQKLPNRIYCDRNKSEETRGSKIMHEKARLTLMVCVSAVGEKVPLALVGNAKCPNCFSLCDKPPIAYTNQENPWFDRSITVW